MKSVKYSRPKVNFMVCIILWYCTRDEGGLLVTSRDITRSFHTAVLGAEWGC